MRARSYIARLLVIILLFAACKSKTEVTVEEKTETGATPVTITQPSVGLMEETIELNATSAFLLKTYVKSTATGYLQMVNAEMGRFISRGQPMFVIRTKEAQSLGNTITSLDSSLHFDGSIQVRSPGTGYISQLNYRSGDYVQDGEQLATITDTRSFVFLLALPYELTRYLAGNRQPLVKLPDSTVLNGYISMSMPTVDSVSQTQRYVIKVNSSKPIPENLIAKVVFVKKINSNAVSLLKSAVLSDETQTRFWIMKMTDSATAVKVPVIKGLESGDKVEIISPRLLASDKILLTGNYGLPDTAKVTIIK
ncbi:MAG: HlyD family efflux transporter periplasmic adaptor subunit [Chitinophagaceae bacterium]|nr:HlyD family efflux transporter periplasmic adaptor subunit [Chitinophagaceae bacterium]